MDTMFDLQLFAEETEGTETTQQPEETTQPTETQPEEQQKEEIPQELDGLPEEAAREAMEEARQEQPPEPAETDSDNKPNEGSPAKDIPYPRFKEVIDQKNAMAAELEAYHAKYGNIDNNAGTQPPQATTPPQGAGQQPKAAEQPAPQVCGLPTMQFTPEISAKIEEAVTQQALQMTGMTAEDFASLEEYGDDDDPKFKMIANAKAMARNYIMGEITEAVRQQQAQRNALIQQRQSMVDDYNAFAQKEFAAPDFKAVQEYAVGDYFKALSLAEQNVLRDAYARIEGNAAMPQDIVLVKRYFTDAKAAFRKGKTQAPAQQQKGTQKPAKPSLPRAAEVDGSASVPSQGITNESIAKMLDTMDVDQLPENVKKLLEG